MRVVMVGTPMCQVCQKLHPVIQEYCEKKQIIFSYYNLALAPKEVLDILSAEHIKQAPAIIIYREGEDLVVFSGDDVFVELESL